jgi:ribonuclease J
MEDGEILELTKDTAQKNGKVTTGRVCIDSGGTIDVVDDVVVRDRQHLSEDGIVLPIITINKRTGRVENLPEIVMRGFALGDDKLIADCRQVIQRTLDSSSPEEKQDYAIIKEKIRNDLKRSIQKSTQRRPLIMPVILEI